MRILKTMSDEMSRDCAVAVVGTWDPLLHVHRELFQRLARRGSRTGLTPTVILLSPSPARLVNPDPDLCLEYSDLGARLQLIRECAPVRVLVVRMTTRDLEAPPKEFFDLLKSHIRLRELWLGAHQTLGRCKQATHSALQALLRRRRIVLRRLKVCPSSARGGAALRCVDEGKLRQAIAQAGIAPMWGRPRSGVLRLNWPAGSYMALPIARPSVHPVPIAAPRVIQIVPARRGGRLDWPEGVDWLSFIAGPLDRSRASRLA